MKLNLPALLSFNAGYVDTAGFLALQGLFTAHVTGNFVTFGASMVLGTSGAVAKLLALPVFCAIVLLTRIFSVILARRRLPGLRVMLAVKLALLMLGAWLAVRLGPFSNGDSLQAIGTGMVFVSAMAIQNAVHRIHLGSAPPTTLMTGTTTQIMIDLADILQGCPPETKAAAQARLRRMSISVASFAIGCLMAALLYGTVQTGCFVVPVVLAAFTLWPSASAEA